MAIRAASHERTSNICGPESMQNSHTQGQKDTSQDSFERLFNAKTFYCVGGSDRFFLFFFVCQALKIKDEVTHSSVQECSKLVGIKKNTKNQTKLCFQHLEEEEHDPRKVFNEIQKEAAFFLYSPFFPPVFFSSQVKAQLVSWLLKRERDT